MYQPAQDAGFGLCLFGLLRLPFEFGACLGVELLARVAIFLDDNEPLSGRLHSSSATELRSCDPTVALGLALLPFLPSFKRSVCDGARTGRDAFWAAFEQQVKDATKFVLETDWPRVARFAWQWSLFTLKRCWRVHVLRLSARFVNEVRRRCGKQVPVASTQNGMSRDRVIDLLTRCLQVQSTTQQTISELARKLIGTDKQGLPFVAAHEKILEVNLPKDPMEEFGISEASLPEILADFETDEQVMMLAGEFLTCPSGRGDPDAAEKLSIDRIVQIHKFMGAKLQAVLAEFQQLPAEKRDAMTPKQREATAELIVSMAVESELGVRCEDAELAVILHEEQLQQNIDFANCTEQLATMMQSLTGAAPLGMNMT